MSPRTVAGSREAGADAVTLMFGHGTGSRRHAESSLTDLLPLTGDDSYVLLADLSHAEYWIRSSDLAHREFGSAQALPR
ncbi:hypothetical protein [Paractinoplanes bogorensis]|uniref:hypothetical protein n=1 Tax=Paractinoplanes bogorensis TaxID=1610840 RepID=UPI001FEC7D43|nr:hypothetical protein [Actinoplanes bogorensis]